MSDTLTGTPAKNYVGGEWRESASGESYEKRSPWRPSRVTGVYPASDAADGRAAVEAAGHAFPAWAALPPAQRAAFFDKAAAAIEARAEQIAQDMTAEMGKPLREARMEAMRAATILRFAAGEAWRPIGEVYAPSVPSQRLYTLRRPARRRRADHALELPDRDSRLEARPGAHPRQHGRAQARLRGAAHGPPRRRGIRRGGTAGGSPQRPHGRRLEGRRRARPAPGRARDLVHRLRAGRPLGARRGDGAQLPRAARARRPESARRDGRRRARPGRRGRPTPAPSGRRGRSARLRAASSSRTPSTTTSASDCSPASPPARSATRPIRTSRSDLS